MMSPVMMLYGSEILLIFGLSVLGSPSGSNDNLQSHNEDFSDKSSHWKYFESHLQVTCDSHYMQVRIKTPSDIGFSGMVYPQGLSKNSSCLKEFVNVDIIEYDLPLRSCNTMTATMGGEQNDLISSNSSDEGQEYFNTIVLEPHPKLVTGHGKDFPIRCKQRRQNLPAEVTMRILRDGQDISGEHVKIGDPLVLNISIESKHRLPFVVRDCLVRDGLGWAEEILVNDAGCTIDSELMGQFLYSNDGRTATVNFLAHKFPYSPSVYYACAVRFCQDCNPPECEGLVNTRKKREATLSQLQAVEEPATIEVYDGLYVNEVTENEAQDKLDEVRRERKASGAILCFNQRDFALAIAISGLILMIAVILLIFVLCLRKRKSFKGSESGGSSVYSGGYTNTAYSQAS